MLIFLTEILMTFLTTLGVLIIIICVVASTRDSNRAFPYVVVAVIVTIAIALLAASSKEEPKPEAESPFMDEDDIYAACEQRAARHGYETGAGCDS